MIAVGILNLGRHLVEIGRLEWDEQSLLSHHAGRRWFRMRDHIDEDLTGLCFLLKSAQDIGPSGAKQLHLNTGLLLEHIGDLLRGLNRHRAIPDDLAFLFRRRHVDRIGRKGRRYAGGEKKRGPAQKAKPNLLVHLLGLLFNGPCRQSNRSVEPATTRHSRTFHFHPCDQQAIALLARWLQDCGRKKLNRRIAAPKKETQDAVSKTWPGFSRVGNRIRVLWHERRLWRSRRCRVDRDYPSCGRARHQPARYV